MEVRVPKQVLDWIDQNKKDKSRPAFIVECLVKMMEDETKKRNK